MIVDFGSTPARRMALRSCDDIGVLLEHLSHVAIALLHLDGDPSARLAGGGLLGEPSDQRHVLLELCIVVVASNERDHGLDRRAADAHGMHVSLAPLGRLGGEPVGWKRAEHRAGELDGIHEPALGRAGMDGVPLERDTDGVGGERLHLELADPDPSSVYAKSAPKRSRSK